MNRPSIAPLLLAVASLLPAAPLPALEARVQRVVNQPFAAGAPGNHESRAIDATPDGRFVLIDTLATNLVAGLTDTNNLYDLVVYDRESPSLDWITVSALDPQQSALGRNLEARISADGRFVAFKSRGRQHTAGATGEQHQLYLFDRQTRATTLVSRPPGDPLGEGDAGVDPGFHISADGRYLAYDSGSTNLVAGDGNQKQDVFLYDRLTGTNTLLTRSAAAPGSSAGEHSHLFGMSADGRFVLLQSAASDLVSGFADNNGEARDLYLWDRDAGSLVLASHAAGSPTAGADAAVGELALLSADGSRAAFTTGAGNLLAGFADNNNPIEADVFVYERAAGTVKLVSGVSPTATQDRGSRLAAISADGGQVFFYSEATDVFPGLVRPADGGDGLFRFTTGTGAMALLNHRAGQTAQIALGSAENARAAADGEAAIFVNHGSEMVAGQTAGGNQVYSYDMATRSARLISHLAGQPLAGATGNPVAIGADHRYVAFGSTSGELLPGSEPNFFEDAFLYDQQLGAPIRLSSTPAAGQTATAVSFGSIGAIPAAGLFLFHALDLEAFLPGITDNGGMDPVLYDPRTGALTALVAPGGQTPAGGDSRASFAADGLNFLLRSTATGLVPGMADGNGAGADLYAGNRTTGGLQLVSSSAASASTSANGGIGDQVVFSASGRFVAYATSATDAVAGQSDANGGEDVILHDRQLGARVLVSRSTAAASQTGNRPSLPVGLSADGELLVFTSAATDLIPGFVDQNGSTGFDYFLYRRSTGAITLVSHSAFSPVHTAMQPSHSGRLSADGRYFVFASRAANLVAGMTNAALNDDTFLHDTATGINTLVSHRAGDPLHGVETHVYPVLISADGRFVLLYSPDTQLIAGGSYPVHGYNTFVYDRLADRCTLISHLPGQPLAALGLNSEPESMSSDGRFVVFSSLAPNVLPGQSAETLESQATFNLFVVDRATGERALLSRSVSSPLVVGNGNSSAAVSGGPAGRQFLFFSQASNLALHDFGGVLNAYLADTTAGGTELFSDGFELGDTSLWSQTVGGN